MYQGKKKLLLSLSFVLIILVLTGGGVVPAQAQEKYPTKAIDIIVPVPAGGGSDLSARITADFLKKRWGVPINVINKPGGGSVIGTLDLYKARPDGYTVMFDSFTSQCVLEIAMKDLPFKVLDKTFIAVTTSAPMVFYVPSTSPMKSLKDVEAEAKRDPGNFTWSSLGGVSLNDFSVRQFFKAIGVDVSKTKPVSVSGGSEVLTLIAGGHIKFGVAGSAPGYSHVKAGTVRVVGVSGYRVPDYPDVPTAVEQGYPGVTLVNYNGFAGPPKLPASIVAQWDQALREAEKDQTSVTKLKGIGVEPYHLNSRETKEYVEKGREEAARLWGVK